MRTMSIASLESANPETQGSAANRGALPKLAGGDTYCLEHFDDAAVLTEAAAPFRVLAVNQKVRTSQILLIIANDTGFHAHNASNLAYYFSFSDFPITFGIYKFFAVARLLWL